MGGDLPACNIYGVISCRYIFGSTVLAFEGTISLHPSHADIADVSAGEICCGGDRLRSANRSFLPAPPVTALRVIVIKL